MNPILLAVDDGLTNANYDMADVFFIIGVVLAALSGLAYATGFVGTVTEGQPRPYARYHQWAPALLAFAVASIAFAWFLL